MHSERVQLVVVIPLEEINLKINPLAAVLRSVARDKQRAKESEARYCLIKLTGRQPLLFDGKLVI